MDFLSWQTEYQARDNYNKNSHSSMLLFHNFYSTIQKSISLYSSTVHSSWEALFNNLISYDNRSSHSKIFFDFYRTFEKHLQKTKVISNKINKDLIEPTMSLTNYIQEQNVKQLNDLKMIVLSTIEQKKKYEISKHRYFDACKLAEKQEKKVLTSWNGDGTKSTQQEAAKQHDIWYKLRTDAEEECQKFKKEHKSTNDLFSNNDKKYFPIVKNLHENEESRKSFISFHFETFISLLEEWSESLQIVIKALHESVFQVNVKEDMKLFEEKFSYNYKPNERFIKEDFLWYDIYRRNVEAIINNNNKLTNKGSTIPMPDISYSLSRNSTMNSISSLSTSTIKLDHYGDVIFSSLFSNNTIEKKHWVSFEKQLKTDAKFAQNVIDKLLEWLRSKGFYQFKNSEKFLVWLEILKDISMNKEVQESWFDLNFAILYIAEKIYYKTEKGVKIYLCKLLSDNYENYKSKIFWKKCLQYIILSKIDNIAKQAFDKKMKNEKRSDKISNLLKNEKNKKEYDEIYEEVKHKDTYWIVKDFINNFTNFKLDMTTSNDIIIEIANEYNLPNEQIQLLISYINSNLYSVKANNFTQAQWLENHSNDADKSMVNYWQKKI